MSKPSRRRRPGGRPVGLTRDAILRAADTFDVQDLSMPALAAVLGVSHAALYHHFPNKQALVVALAEFALRRVHLPEVAGRAWRELIVEAACAMRGIMLEHPQYGTHVAASASSAATPIAERIFEALRSAGCSREQALRLVELIFAWVLYSASQSAYLAERGMFSDEQLHAYLDDTAVAADSPMRSLVSYYVRTSDDERFKGNLELLLDSVQPSSSPAEGEVRAHP